MAFGITREELREWQQKVRQGSIAFLTHYWYDARFPHCRSVTKVGCAHIHNLKKWGMTYDLSPDLIDYHHKYPHFDLFGDLQLHILMKENQWEQINRFRLKNRHFNIF